MHKHKRLASIKIIMHKRNIMKIIDDLFDRIKAEQLSETEICKSAQIAQTTLLRWKLKRTLPRLETLEKVNEAVEQLSQNQQTTP